MSVTSVEANLTARHNHSESIFLSLWSASFIYVAALLLRFFSVKVLAGDLRASLFTGHI